MFLRYMAKIPAAADILAQFLRDGEPNITKFLDDIHTSSMLLDVVLYVGYIASFRNCIASKSKNRSNWHLTPV